MLLSVCLVLKPRTLLALPPTWGRAARGFFLNQVRKFDKVLAKQLHVVGGGLRPYTISFSHWEAGRDDPGPADQDFWLRITSLDKRVSNLLLAGAVGTTDAEPLKILTAEFEVIKVCLRPEEHPWAGESSFVELYNNWVARAKSGELPEVIRLKFCSPTAFATSGSQWDLPLPLPRLVFQSLWNKWMTFSSIPLELNVDEIGRCVGIRWHRLKTQMLNFGGRDRQVGFIGECEFGIRREAGDKFRREINLLADFAFYAGVGKKTAWGMGRVRRIDTPRGV